MHMHTPHLHMHMLMLMHMHMHAPPYHRANPAWPEESNSHSLRFCSAFASPQAPSHPPPHPSPNPKQGRNAQCNDLREAANASEAEKRQRMARALEGRHQHHDVHLALSPTLSPTLSLTPSLDLTPCLPLTT